jgi:hypothetical protein
VIDGVDLAAEGGRGGGIPSPVVDGVDASTGIRGAERRESDRVNPSAEVRGAEQRVSDDGRSVGLADGRVRVVAVVEVGPKYP